MRQKFIVSGQPQGRINVGHPPGKEKFVGSIPIFRGSRQGKRLWIEPVELWAVFQHNLSLTVVSKSEYAQTAKPR
jgi:hypothetical protein